MTGARIAVVTGANRGIGAAIASRLAEHGLRVIETSREPLAGFDAEVAKERWTRTSTAR